MRYFSPARRYVLLYRISLNFLSLKTGFGIDFLDYTQTLPHSPSGLAFIDARMEFIIKKVTSPIGMTILPNGYIVIASSKQDVVKIFDETG